VSSGTKILVVDDEPAILRALTTNLRARGYIVSGVETAEEALAKVEEGAPDLLVLDLMLPKMSGLELCEAIRREWTFPILVLSARGEERAKVRALDLGADDYVTKPFGIDEVIARIRALLRRPAGMQVQTGTIEVGSLAIDLGTREARRNGQAVELTAREYDVLLYLMRNAGKVVTHRMLLGAVWGPEYKQEAQYLRVFVNRLRRKIEEDPAHPRHIVTDPGVGYRVLPVE
jgi:two-component system, OmpR family, KDP operon response regulator KdpE